MFPKENRLNLGKDFKRVASGKKIDTKFVKLFLKTGDNSSPKVGIAISGKFFKKATERSRAKRLVSSALESVYGSLPLDINILALPKPSILGVKSDELSTSLKTVLKHEKIID